jgi:hypothetical protein
LTSVAAEDLTVEQVIGARAAIEYYYEQGWTDGLPVVPPIQQFVDEFVAHSGRQPDEVISYQDHLFRQCTVRQAAINAVMAGCKPEHFPVVLAALEACEDRGGSWRSGLLQSTTGAAVLLIMNGPLRTQLGFNCKSSVFGPGYRANATIGRAIRLIIMNVFGIRPNEFESATQGTPGKYTMCIAENEEDSPWEPLHVERGFASEKSTVSALFVRSTLHVEQRNSQEPEVILSTIADSMSYAGSILGGPGRDRSLIVMGPEHARLIAQRGWSKQDVKEFLTEHHGRTKAELARAGKPVRGDRPQDAFVRFSTSPDDLLLVVAGANNCGISAVLPPIGGLGATRPVPTVSAPA